MRNLSVLAVVVGAFFVLLAGSSLASTTSSTVKVMVATNSPCPNGYTCVPADVSTTKSSSSSSSSHVKVVEKTTLVPQVKQYMTMTRVAVTIDQIPGGIKSSVGCIDPVKKGYIKPQGDFSNTGGLIQYRFTDHWVDGTLLCNYHLVRSGGEAYLQGTKSSCGNKNIRIYLTPHKFTKYVPVKRFYSVTDWTKTYNKWVSSTKSSKSTSTSSTKYSCSSGTLYGDLCITPTPGNNPPPPPPPPPTPPSLKISNLSQPQLAPGGIAADGETVTFCVDAQDTKVGDQVKTTFKANLGSFPSGIVTVTSTGSDQVCATFAAPNDSGDTGQIETITVDAIDTTAGVTSNSLPPLQFTYQPPPNGGVHPTN